MTGAQGPAGPTGAQGAAGSTLTKAQVRNTDITTNINQTLATDVPLTGTTDFLDAGFAVSGDGIQCNFTGDVKVDFSVYFESLGVRVGMDFTIAVNGTSAGPIFNQNYIRNTGSHNSSGTSGSMWLSVTSGDVITIQATRSTGTTDSAELAIAGASLLLVERWN